jgi:hypothetical protein
MGPVPVYYHTKWTKDRPNNTYHTYDTYNHTDRSHGDPPGGKEFKPTLSTPGGNHTSSGCGSSAGAMNRAVHRPSLALVARAQQKLRFRIHGRERECPRRDDDRCRRPRSHSSRRPLLFFAVAVWWCLGPYCRLWMSLYRSFDGAYDDADVDALGPGRFAASGRRRDLSAVGLRRFMSGGVGGRSGRDATAAETKTGDGAVDGESDAVESREPSQRRTNGNSPSLEQQLWSPIIAERVRAVLISRTGYPNLVLGAYLEPPLPLLAEVSNDGESLMKMRVHGPRNLTYVPYPPHRKNLVNGGAIMDNQPGACSRNGAQWTFPTSHPKSLDHHFEGNVFRRRPNFDRRWELAAGIVGNGDDADGYRGGHCPVDADPYLPWIHDAFPSDDGSHVEFVVSNKRRCNTDPARFGPDLKNLEPQVALMQPVPVRRIREGLAEFDDALGSLRSAAPGGRGDATTGYEAFVRDDGYVSPRYALATSLDDADEDARYTRFVCRFHTLGIDDEVAPGGSHGAMLRRIILGETLSTYTYNPEHANYRKRGSKPMLLDGHDEQIWNSVYNIRCPVPRDVGGDALPGMIATGKSVLDDGVPLLYLDLIPIRTPARRSREGFGLPGVTDGSFDPERAWGNSRVLPRIEASGRWANIPVCRPPGAGEGSAVDPSESASAAGRPDDVVVAAARGKTHFLVACVWASRSFSTRGQDDDADSSTAARLREFLTYHLRIAGFDHAYVYDNSDATSSNGTLADVTDSFPRRLVTRVPWPHRVCNNNPPAAANPGERSSQYAAESSCRARYGPGTTWMATLDVDEYLVPTGERWKTLRQWLEHVTGDESDTKILNFYQTRALPNIDLMVPYKGGPTASCEVDKNRTTLNSVCVMKVWDIYLIKILT